jgi:hypothetical protein
VKTRQIRKVGNHNAVCREILGPGSRKKRSRFRRIVRSLNSAGFAVGRKVVLGTGGRRLAIAFPNYIRAKRGSIRMPDEVTLEQIMLLVFLARG